MLDEAIISLYAQRFSDSRGASFILDSIAHQAGQLGLSESSIQNQLEEVCAITTPYGVDAVEALRVIDRIYDKGVKEKNSRVCRYGAGRLLKDPMVGLRKRTLRFFSQQGRRLELAGLDLAAEDVLVACER